MNIPLRDSDTLPWYRQFWPWFLIMLPATVVVAGLSTLYIANRHADDLVADDYYKDGLAINKQLAKIERASALGLSARLRFSADEVSVDVSGSNGDAALQLLLSHPLESDRDFSVPLTQLAPGHYLGRLEHPVAARWHWTLLAPESTDGWRLDGSIGADEMLDAPAP